MTGASTKDQLARLLALAPYLQTRGAVPLKQVAADFSVSREQMLKDLRVLYLCGLPGFGPGDLIEINVEALLDDPEGVVRINNADFLARPLRLGSNEASALIVGLQALQESSALASRELVERPWPSSKRPPSRVPSRQSTSGPPNAHRRSNGCVPTCNGRSALTGRSAWNTWCRRGTNGPNGSSTRTPCCNATGTSTWTPGVISLTRAGFSGSTESALRRCCNHREACPIWRRETCRTACSRLVPTTSRFGSDSAGRCGGLLSTTRCSRPPRPPTEVWKSPFLLATSAGCCGWRSASAVGSRFWIQKRSEPRSGPWRQMPSACSSVRRSMAELLVPHFRRIRK
jgi:hypothetical protein